MREAVELAFVTAVQLLPPKQRAVLILRDVLGWSAKETAEALEDSVPAVNSALQRARASLDRARRLGAPAHNPGDAERVHALLRRLMEAWDAVDIDGIVALLARDAMMTMPPTPTYVHGAEAIGGFFATVPAQGFLNDPPWVSWRLDYLHDIFPSRPASAPLLSAGWPASMGAGCRCWELKFASYSAGGMSPSSSWRRSLL
jgi:hypothetical protein